MQEGGPAQETADVSVRQELERVLGSETFGRSPRHCELLRWVVERALRGESAAKEYEIGTSVLGRSASWDPRLDPMVRIEFRRLRQRLAEYYQTEGASKHGNDRLRIQIAERGYGVEIVKAPVEVIGENEIVAATATSGSVESHDHDAQKPLTAAALRQPGRLRRLTGWMLVAVVTMGVGAVVLTRYSRSREGAGPALTAIAVLPFLNTGPDPADNSLADGFTDELTTTLAAIPFLRVTARTSAQQFRSKGADIREVGRQLNVGSLVEGSIQHSAGETRIIVQLNRTSDGTHLWAQTFDSAGKNLLDIQEEVARSITYHVRSRVGDAQSLDAAMRQGRVHLSRETADAYLRGLAESAKFTPRSTDMALALFDRVIADAPDFGDGYGARGMVHTQLADSSAGDTRKESKLAVADLRRALELHTRFAAHVLVNLAYLEYRMDWDWQRAEAHIKESLAQADTAYAHRIYGWGLITQGRIAEGEEQFRKMLELDPLNVINRAAMAEALLEASRFGPASEQASEVTRLHPRWWLASAVSAQVDIYQKKPTEALAKLAKIGGTERNAASVQLGYAAVEAEQRRNKDAVDILRKLEAGAAGVPPIRYYVGVVYGLLGEPSRLFEYLDKSADEREYEVLYTKIDPLLSRWQSDPRMVQLEQRLGLAGKE